jgi:hypothetical protein
MSPIIFFIGFLYYRSSRKPAFHDPIWSTSTTENPRLRGYLRFSNAIFATILAAFIFAFPDDPDSGHSDTAFSGKTSTAAVRAHSRNPPY